MALLLSRTIWAGAKHECAPTPAQTEGPFYPPRTQIETMSDQDQDLTRVGN